MNSIQSSSPPRSPVIDRITWVFCSIVFLALPFWLVIGEVERTFRADRDHQQLREFSRMEQFGMSLLRRQEPVVYFSKVIEKFFSHLFADPLRPTNLPFTINRLHRRFRGIFEVSVLNSSGELSYTDSPILRSDPHVQAAMTAFFLFYSGKCPPAELAKHWPTLHRFLGPLITLDQILQKNLLLTTHLLPEEECFSATVDGRGLLFVRLRTSSLWERRMLEDVIRRAGPLCHRYPYQVRLADRFAPPSSADLAAAISQGSPDGINRFVGTDSLILWFPAGERHLMALSHPLSEGLPASGGRTRATPGGIILQSLFGHQAMSRLVFWIGLLLVGLGSALLHPQWRDFREALPLRLKLAAWFGYAGFLPLLFLLVFSRSFLAQQREEAFNQLKDELFSEVHSFDEHFEGFVRRMESALNHLWFPVSSPSGEITPRMDGTLKTTALMMAQAEGLIYNRKGKLVLSHVPAKTPHRGGIKILESLSRNILATKNREQLSSQVDLLGVILETLPFSRNPLYEILRQFQRMAEYSWANDQSISYLTSIPGPTGMSEFLVVLFNSRAQVYRHFFGKERLNRLRKTPGKRLAGYQFSKNTWFPPPSRGDPPLYWLVQKLRISPEQGSGEFWYANRPYLAIGVPSKKIPDFCLLVTVPLTGLQEREDRSRGLVLGFVILMISFMVFCRRSIGASIFRPLREIEQGIGHIRRRDFSLRLPHLGSDEMGDLVTGMNRALESLQELEVAKKIQEFFLPPQTVSLGAYSAYGKTVQMVGLGGDYVEIKTLKPPFLLLFLGDVSGHGIPAALIMSMAKAVVEEACHTTPDLLEIAAALNRIILSHFKREWMMTGMFILTDTTTHQILVLNAGHPRALHCRRGTFLQEVGNPSFPLGASAKPRFTPSPLALEPGDALLLFSDGLNETHRTDGEPIGLERLHECLPPLVSDCPQATCTAIFSWFHQQTLGKPAEDDVSVLALIRKP